MLTRVEGPANPEPSGSRGCHALTRSLPVAVVGTQWARQAGEFAALTHGDPAAALAASQAAVLVHHCLVQSPPDEGYEGSENPVRAALAAGIAVSATLRAEGADGGSDSLLMALQHAVEQPAQSAVLARLAPDATAPSALLGGVYAAASFPGRERFRDALEFAAEAPDGDSVACVTGALLGAVHGIEALPVEWVSRHELAWVLDTLARDLLRQADLSPSGDAYNQGWDPHWWDRYPGW